MDTEEEWRWIPGWEDLYEVSSIGRVRSWTRGRSVPLVLQPITSRGGYLKVGLWRSRKVKQVEVHALVAAAFIGPRAEGLETRHLDGTRQNNVVSNLAYGTPRDNQMDRYDHGTAKAQTVDRCVRGHLFTDENTYRWPGRPSSRQCKACSRMREGTRAKGEDRKVGAPLAADDPRHGTASGYSYRKCRCDKCVAHNSEMCRKRSERQRATGA